MITSGIITNIEKNIVTVKTHKASNCSHCNKCSDSNKFANEIKIKSDENLNKDDVILFEMEDKDIFRLGALIYLLPVTFFFIGYFLSSIFTTTEIYKIISSFLGVFLSFIIIKIYDTFFGKDFVQKIIIKEVHHNEN